MGAIVTISGVSGSGKSTLARELLARMSGSRLITSCSVHRPARPSDLPGEYTPLTGECYNELALNGKLLWTASHGSIRYATRTYDVDHAIASPGTYLMILVPGVVRVLRAYLASRGALKAHRPLFIVHPGETIIKRRLAERGEKPETIALRAILEHSWDGEAGVSGVPYSYIRNDGSLEEAYAQVARAII